MGECRQSGCASGRGCPGTAGFGGSTSGWQNSGHFGYNTWVEPQPPRTRNPHTKVQIDRESFWQIWLPIGLAILVVIGLVVWASVPGAAEVRGPIADVSLVLLIVVWVVLALVAFVIGAAVIYGLYWLLRESPFWFKRGQDIIWIVSQQTRSTTRQVEDVLTSANAGAAGARRVADRFRDLFTRN